MTINLIKIRFIIAALAGALCCMALHAKKPYLTYVDADALTVINRAQEQAPGWQRLDVDRYPDLTPKVKSYYSYPTGLAVAFRTNSPRITARWKTTGKGHGVNTTAIAQSGLALYIKSDGKWTFAGVGKPTYNAKKHSSTIIQDMADGQKDCILYLPIYDGLDSLEIGVDSACTISAMPNPFPRKKIVVIGSSITHGSAVSHPGMAYPARLERMLDMEFANLGASGQCKLEEFYARIAADSKADAFVFDTFSNPSAEQIEQRLEPFVRIVRKAHPETPLIFLQTLRRETTNFNRGTADFENAKREAAARGMKKILAEYDNVYFIDPGMPIGDDHDATCDGVHPSDLGMDRILQVIAPQIREIIR